MELSNAITWFEIPAKDLGRATSFYEQVLGCKLKRETMGEMVFSVFPAGKDGVSGCVIAGDGQTPSRQGQCIYLQAGPRLDDALARVGKAGGSIALPKTALPEGMGYFAQIIDCEGNRVGLHALQ